MNIKNILCAVSVLLATSLSSAQLMALEVKPAFGFGVTGGGDDIVTVPFNDGTTQEISAGGLVHFYGGVSINSFHSEWTTRLTIGYHVDDATATNGSVTFDRIPLDAFFFSNFADNQRIGAGLSYHLNPEISVDIDGSFLNGSAEYDSALGYGFEYGFKLSNRMWLDFRYVFIEYVGDGLITKDGSHLGVYASSAFNM